MKKIVLTAVAALVIAGCNATYGTNEVTADGQLKEGVKLSWPSVSKAVIKEGIFPTNEDLYRLKPEITKRQLLKLFDVPHFSESANSREWNYIMKFRQFDDSVRTCQLKIFFDKKYRGQSFHWLPEDCLFEKFDLSADVLFAFGKKDRQDIKEAGIDHLNRLADYLKNLGPQARAHLVGYTDYIGSEKDNLKLSLERAETVKRYLIEKGVPHYVLSAEGRGKQNQVKRCEKDGHGRKYRAGSNELHECLMENRRVTVEIQK